jgi:hypothetical protein
MRKIMSISQSQQYIKIWQKTRHHARSCAIFRSFSRKVARKNFTKNQKETATQTTASADFAAFAADPAFSGSCLSKVNSQGAPQFPGRPLAPSPSGRGDRSAPAKGVTRPDSRRKQNYF